jgi:hypothetical protein
MIIGMTVRHPIAVLAFSLALTTSAVAQLPITPPTPAEKEQAKQPAAETAARGCQEGAGRKTSGNADGERHAIARA